LSSYAVIKFNNTLHSTVFDVQVSGSVSLMWYYGERYERWGVSELKWFWEHQWSKWVRGSCLDCRAFKGLAAGTIELHLQVKFPTMQKVGNMQCQRKTWRPMRIVFYSNYKTKSIHSIKYMQTVYTHTHTLPFKSLGVSKI